MFEICIDMLNCFHKCHYVTVGLLSEEDYTKLKTAAATKAKEITDKIFKNQIIDKSVFISLLSYHNYEWISEPHLICENLLNEAGISINLRCYDNNEIEAKAMQRNEWIAKFNLEQQEEEQKRQEEAAALKMELLDEEFKNEEFSDGSEQEQEHAQRHISERVDGLSEYQQNLPLSKIKYNDFI